MTVTPLKVPRVISLRVRYAETDQMGVVYHANYFVWFEIGRCELMRASVKTYKNMEEDGLALPVIEAHCEYKSPARYDDELEVKTWGKLLSPVRVEFRYEVSRPSDGTLLAVGRTVHAGVDGSSRPRRLPNYVTDLLK